MALELLREGYSFYPHNNVLRLQLALALYKNKDYGNALLYLEKVKSDESEPVVINKINRYIEAIQKTRRWSASVEFSMENDNNINLAPANSRYKNWRFSRPVKDNYIRYNTFFSHTLPVGSNYGVLSKFIIRGKHYKKHSRYDTTSFLLSSGLVFENYKTRLILQPVIEHVQRSKSSVVHQQTNVGGAYQWSFFISNKLNLNSSGDYKFSVSSKDISELWVNFGALYLYRPWLYTYSSVGQLKYRYSDLKTTKDIYILGLGYDWDNGISSKLQTRYSRQRANYVDIFGYVPGCAEVEPSVIIWHRNIDFVGLTPKLHLSRILSRSTHPLYRYEKYSVAVSVSRSF